MAVSQIGVLIPINSNDLSEETSIPRIPISQGPNIVGRNSIPVVDKRLSRKHLTLTGSIDGSADVSVEGSNPVVIRSRDERKKLHIGEKLKIRNGDVIEFIPGHHLYKYVTLSSYEKTSSPNVKKRPYKEDNDLSAENSVGRKKLQQQVSQDEDFARNLQAEFNDDSLVRKSSSEPIRHFNPPNNKLPLTFRLLQVQGLPSWANSNAVSISDVIQGDVLVAVLSNYMVDIDWLISACPILKRVPNVLVVHGQSDGSLEHMKKILKPTNWRLHKPPLPISYGTHHSKAMLLVYPRGVRVIVHTANLIHVDWNNKTQGLWMQDFPWKDQTNQAKVSVFENDLIDYLSALKLPEFNMNIPGHGNFNFNASFFKNFDYSSASVRLIASVPGYHSGPHLKKWGHMKLRTVLQECIFDKQFKKSPLIYQFSSLGSLDEKWMTEFAYSMSAGVSDDKSPLGLGDPLIVWPTVEDVRCSLEGYAAGSCIPSAQKNVEKEFLKKYWSKWKASHTGRGRAMPHIKTFTRYNGQNLAWFLLTSSNLSKAAWGALQKNNSQLMIRSYELGVLFLPTTQLEYNFSCTNNTKPSEEKCGPSKKIEGGKRSELVTLCWQGNESTNKNEMIHLPVPYDLPPQRYTSEDVPWSWDRRYLKKDVYGQVWPR